MYARAGEVRIWPAGESRILFATSCLVGLGVGDAAEPPATPTSSSAMAIRASRAVRYMFPPMHGRKSAPTTKAPSRHRHLPSSGPDLSHVAERHDHARSRSAA